MQHSFNARKAALAHVAVAAAFFLTIVLGLTRTSMAQSSNLLTPGSAPRTLTYQGLIANGDRPIADGMHAVTVTLYTDASGTASIWQATYKPQVTNGIFNVVLGDGNPLPEASRMDRPLWIGVQVDNGPEMRPLSPLSASAYAVNVADNSVTSAKLANGAVTHEKISAEYVGSISVNGEKISANGGDVNFIAGNGMEMAFDPGTGTVTMGTGNASTTTDGKGAKPLWTGYNPGGANQNDDGTLNTVPDLTNVVGGGWKNQANPWFGTGSGPGGFATEVGGEHNHATGKYSFVGGGDTNSAGAGAGFGDYSAVVGGTLNFATGKLGFIGGGRQNAASDVNTVVGGGENNSSNGVDDAIVGGSGNTTQTDPFSDFDARASVYSIIGGGVNNVITGGDSDTPDSAHASSILGGQIDSILTSSFAIVGGGFDNKVGTYTNEDGVYNPQYSDYSGILGGDSNTIVGKKNAIGGGVKNFISGLSSTIGGGDTNIISNSTHRTAVADVIGGGYFNIVSQGDSDVIGGGAENNMWHVAASTISGGTRNQISCISAQGGDFSFIGGGKFNQLRANYSVIGGGDSNTILCQADFSTIGGGHGNMVQSSVTHATIPGGDSLVAESFAQTVVGYNNASTSNPLGSFLEGMPNDWPSNASNANDFLFIVGNGNGTGHTPRSNAFEVSYDGHSIVHDDDANGLPNATRPAIVGGTFVDNVTYAWGDIFGTFTGPGPCTGTVHLVSSFGVASVAYICAGQYRVTLNTTGANGLPPNISLAHGFAVTTTNVVVPIGVTCRNITVTPLGWGGIGPNTFDIFILDPQNGCTQVDGHIMFEVHGRP